MEVDHRAVRLARKLTNAARLVAQVESSLNQKKTPCDHCGTARFDNFDEAKAAQHLGQLAKSLYGQADAILKKRKK